MNRTILGGLHAVVTGGTDGQGGGDGPVVVLLHGFGAPGDDLVPLARFLAVPRAVRFVFPAAPLALDLGFGPGDSRAWWMIDIERIQRELASGQPRNLVREVPAGLPAARAQVIALLCDVAGKLGGGRVVLGGFSQGAMLACDVALRTARPLAGLVLLSGTLLAEDEWVPLMPARRGLPVLESHGQLDPLLPFFVAEMLRDHLVAAGLAVEWVPFRGGHEIPAPVLDRLGAFLGRALADG